MRMKLNPMRNRPVIALAGNPNVGKTCLFNALTGSHQTVGNWPGVTVEHKSGRCNYKGKIYEVVDLPGIYSLAGGSPDELVARNYILTEKPDIIINIVDASNLERNLYLTVQLMELGAPLIMCLSMIDIAEHNGIYIDTEHLSSHLGFAVFPLVLNKRIEVSPILDKVEEYLVQPPVPATIHYDEVVEKHLQNIWQIVLKSGLGEPETKIPQRKFSESASIAYDILIKSRWQALKLIEGDAELTSRLSDEDRALVEKEISAIAKHRGQEPTFVIADDRYGYIRGLIKDVVKRKRKSRLTFSDMVDKVVLNSVVGLPVFFIVMYLVFLVAVKLSQPCIKFIEFILSWLFIEQLGNLLSSLSFPQWLNYLLSEAIGGGIVTIGSFIPPIFFIYISLSILEDSGYMARAAFIADKFMRKIGLPGKAFIPLLVGFGCTVPAIMATRTLENPRDRVFASILTPFVSCGAKLPVYTFLVMLFFPLYADLVIFGLYLFGIIMGVLTGLLLKKTIFLSAPGDFVMELPAYHIPTINGIFMHTWHRLKSFLLRAGKTILLVIVLINILQGIQIPTGRDSEKTSILELGGKLITPVLQPMGIKSDNWQSSVALISGLFAKEAIVGTLQGLYQNSEGEISGDQLANNIKSSFGSNASILAYLVFILLYSPCAASLTMLFKEHGFKWMLFAFVYLTLLAWMVATLIYQILAFNVLSIFWFVVIGAIFTFIYITLRKIGSKYAFQTE
ncbi:Ferrous ion uptake system protein FeoB (predicted GTPase) [Candidatus Cloacimonas acidaminovorans str. Evry]|uniref:Ferrous iron transport protein B n=2 Tax=Candidatus Cloacimonas TaxID=456826 RepID=B0VJP6_CLOAI|nr:Ferrous ion uptake system protein FeoB (predicted GTPase) [Candidatus Cloacimonas acidaminovorans str. Evry]